jgi:Flp pilus assembly protein TadB
MFYVLIFSLAAVILIVAFFTAMSRRRRTMRGEDMSVGASSGQTAHIAHGTHPNDAARKNRKAKRSQSQHDRRKRR